MKLSTLYTTSNLPYVRLSDTKSSGTAGTSYASGAYRTVTINTENSDSEEICSLSSNQFTLSSGKYAVSLTYQAFRNASCFYAVRIRNTSGGGSTVIKWPACAVQDRANEGTTTEYLAYLDGQFTVAASQALELQVYASGNVSQSALTDGENEVYWIVELVKLD